MELDKFEKATEIKKKIDECLHFYRFLVNDSVSFSFSKLDFSSEWESMRLPDDFKEITMEYLKERVKQRIHELEQQFKEL